MRWSTPLGHWCMLGSASTLYKSGRSATLANGLGGCISLCGTCDRDDELRRRSSRWFWGISYTSSWSDLPRCRLSATSISVHSCRQIPCASSVSESCENSSWCKAWYSCLQLSPYTHRFAEPLWLGMLACKGICWEWKMLRNPIFTLAPEYAKNKDFRNPRTLLWFAK